MDRRDFLTGAAGAGLGALVLGASGPAAARSEIEQSESAKALAELTEAIAGFEQRFVDQFKLRTETEYAEARRAVLHHLQHGIEAWLESDPARPVFKRFVTPEKKMLGDNPDAVYFTTAIDPTHSYRIRGNLADATYTSFTVELGSQDGNNASGLGATLNDTEFSADADGNYVLVASPEPQEGNWLRLDPGAGSVTTRHYYERELSIARDRLHHVPIMIERVDDPGPSAPPSDASIAAGIRRVTNFMTGTLNPTDPSRSPAWVSFVPNQFSNKQTGNNVEVGFAAIDNAYQMAPFVVKPDEALVISGRFPDCRFANLVLWNRHIQTFDYTHRNTSINRKQTKLEADGSFRVVVAQNDPGVPNWLDTEGHVSGMMFWRFQLADEEIPPLETELVKLASLK
jgi:hypothetical protein